MSGETVLRKKRIAVVSERQALSDFFRLEAESCGCSVNVMAEMPYELSEYDMIITDISDNAHSRDCTDSKIYRVITNEAPDIENRILSYPMSLNTVRGLFAGGVAVTAEAEKDKQPLIICAGENGIIYNNNKIQLTDGESRVLTRLGQSAGKPVSRQELMELFGAEVGNIADVYICRLRGKLEDPEGKRLIRTVRGKGYALVAKIENINDRKRREK